MNKYIITDEEEACEAIKEILKEEYEKNIVDWQRELDRKDSVEKKEFLKVMDQLLRLVGKEQKEGRKEKIEQIYICYLRSSLLDGSFDLAIHAYSKRVYFDLCETEMYWCPNTVKEYYFSAIQKLEHMIKRKNIVLARDKVKEIEKKHYFDYLLFLPKMCNLLMPEVRQMESYKTADISRDLIVFFGEFMGAAEPVYIYLSEETLEQMEQEMEKENEILHHYK